MQAKEHPVERTGSPGAKEGWGVTQGLIRICTRAWLSGEFHVGGAQRQQEPEMTPGPETTPQPYKAQTQGYWNFPTTLTQANPWVYRVLEFHRNHKQGDRGFTVLDTLWGFFALPLCWSEVHLPWAVGLSLVWGRW
jgi:hypothetical protein